MRRRFIGFAVRMLLLAIAATAFVSFTWLHFTRPAGPVWAWWMFPMLLTGSFVPALLLGFRFTHPLLRVLTIVSAVAIGFLSFSLLAALASWVAAPFSGAHSRSVVLALFAAAAGVAAAGLINAVIPRTVRRDVMLAGLPSAWENATVALVSDIHLGNVRAGLFVRHLVWRLNRHRPRAVFISGDMFDGTQLDLGRAARGWAELKAPAGTYFVSGNHDDRNRGAYLAALRQVGIRVLDDEKIEVDGLQIVGVHDAETRSASRYRQILQRAGLDRGRASVLLAHQPINLNLAEEAGISLQLSGHTHGGQFFPWSLIARRVHGPFVYGLQRFGRMQIYTSSGAGTWGPPFRVGTRSEIVLLRLRAGPVGSPFTETPSEA